MAAAQERGPVVVITGAARGIGAATARHMARAGWSMVLVDRCADDEALDYPLATYEDLEATVDACGAHRAVAVVGDVRDQGALERAVAVAQERFGGVDAAVAAAGCIAGGPELWRTEDATWAAIMGINVEGVWRLARAAIPAILSRSEPHHGRFVAIASAASVTGLPRLAAYTAAKHAVAGLIRALAIELGPLGVTANAVAPGSTTTHMLGASADVYGLASTEEFAIHHPLGRLLHPDEIAAAVAWLCSAEASGITGALLPVDAGMTAG